MGKQIFLTENFKIFSKVLREYEQWINKDDTLGFIEKEIKENNCYQSNRKIKEVSNEISQTIDNLDESFHSLRAFRNDGGSRDSWLKSTIEKAISSLPEGDQGSLIKEIKEALIKANGDIFMGLYQVKMPSELSTSLNDYSFKGINSTAIIQNLNKDIHNNTLLSAITMAEGFKVKVDKEHSEIKAVTNYLRTKLDDSRDKDFKKVLTTAAIISREKGYIPLKRISNSDIAAIVDLGVSKVKLAYKLAEGEINPTDVVDYVIDKTASSIGSVVTHSCQKIGSNVGGAIGGAIGTIFGPVGASIGTVIGGAVGHIAGTVIGTTISKGIEKVATICKNVVSNTWEGLKSIASNVIGGLASWIGF